MAQLVKNLLEMQDTWVQSLGWEAPLEKGKATYSSILAWSQTQRVRHNCVTFTLLTIDGSYHCSQYNHSEYCQTLNPDKADTA